MSRSPEMLYQQRLSNAGGVGDTLQDKLILTLLAEFIIPVPDHFSLFANGALWQAGRSCSDIYNYLKGEGIKFLCCHWMQQKGKMCYEVKKHQYVIQQQ